VSEYWELKDVKPLFNVPACVVFAEEKKGKERKSWPAQFWSGDMKGSRNLSWERAREYLNYEEGKLYLAELGNRNAMDRSRIDVKKSDPSPYLSEFYQGATIVPRNFYFIEKPSESDLKKDELFVRTDPEQAREGKAPWKDIFLEGNIERELLYRTALSKHILPFYVEEDLPWIILPLLPPASGKDAPVLADSAALNKAGFRGGAAWFSKADQVWRNYRREKKNMDLQERLNYQNGLTKQIKRKKWIIEFIKSGTNISSATIANHDSYFSDYTNYWYSTNDHEEADYLVGIFNSSIVNFAIKPFQTTGALGERDICKTLLELPIPRFEAKNSLHAEIAAESATAHELVVAAAQKGALQGSLAVRRRIAREVAALPLSHLDTLVRRLLGI
jgi:hypothetical protein